MSFDPEEGGIPEDIDTVEVIGGGEGIFDSHALSSCRHEVASAEAVAASHAMANPSPTVPARGKAKPTPDIKALVNYDAAKVLGSTAAATLKLWTDDVGLAFKG